MVGALYKNLGRVRVWGHSPSGAHPQKCGVWLQRWENQRRLSSLAFVMASNVEQSLQLTVVETRRSYR